MLLWGTCQSTSALFHLLRLGVLGRNTSSLLDIQSFDDAPLTMTDEESHHTTDSQFNHQLVLPENCVEYFLFVVDPALEARKKLSQLEALRQNTLHLSQSLTKDYIWQRDEFNLELRNENGEILLPEPTRSTS